MGRSAEAIARRAEKRGRSVEEELAVEEARSVRDQKCKPAVGPTREGEELQKREAEASSEATSKERKPRQPLPANHKQGRRSGAMRRAAKELRRMGGGDRGPLPRPPAAAPAAKPAAATKAAGRAGTKRASTRDGLVVWLVDDDTVEATPHVILQSELREPPEPRASRKYLLLEPLPAGRAGAAHWVHSRAVLPLDARLASLWPQLKLVPQRREAVQAALVQQQKVLSHLSVHELWGQLMGGLDEPCPA